MIPKKEPALTGLLASRATHPHNTVVKIGNHLVGDGNLTMIAGPSAIENEQQIFTIATQIKAAGAHILYGGAFNACFSPYQFQGLGEEGLRLLLQAGKAVGLPVATEITSVRHLPLYEDVDLIQVGAKNMQNFHLLAELGHSQKPVLLERGISNTVEELLMSAEYILSGGNKNVILCEGGIRTYDSSTHNTLDVSSVPILHELTHLPMLVDPSHTAGNRRLVRPLARAAAAVGADGLILEVHNNPEHALGNGRHRRIPEELSQIVKETQAIRQVLFPNDPIPISPAHSLA